MASHPKADMRGFTLIELVITVAILGIIIGFSAPNFEGWNDKRGFNNGREALLSALSQAKNEALSRNTTTRVSITGEAGNYIANIFIAPTPVSNCTSSGSWTLLASFPIAMPEKYTIAGTSLVANCFYRDSTASASSLTISSSTAPETLTVTVTMATGVLDVQ